MLGACVVRVGLTPSVRALPHFEAQVSESSRFYASRAWRAIDASRSKAGRKRRRVSTRDAVSHELYLWRGSVDCASTTKLERVLEARSAGLSGV